jgi:hypothetical protein
MFPLLEPPSQLDSRGNQRRERIPYTFSAFRKVSTSSLKELDISTGGLTIAAFEERFATRDYTARLASTLVKTPSLYLPQIG